MVLQTGIFHATAVPTQKWGKIALSPRLPFCESHHLDGCLVCALQIVRRIDVAVRGIKWSDNGDLVAILSEASFYILAYDREVHANFRACAQCMLRRTACSEAEARQQLVVKAMACALHLQGLCTVHAPPALPAVKQGPGSRFW